MFSFSRLIRGLCRFKPAQPTLTRKQPFRLFLEQLEDRCQPSTVTWLNPVSGDWSVGANWSTGSVPVAGDNVVIDQPGVDITVTFSTGSVSIASLTCAESLSITGGALTLTGAGQVTGTFAIGPDGALTASGAAASFTASGATTVNGATLTATGGGVIDLPNAFSYAFPGGNFRVGTLKSQGAGSRLELDNMATIAGGPSLFAVLNIQALSGGVIDLHGTTSMASGGTAVLADGAGSTIDLSALTTFNDTNSTSDSALIARNGGTVMLAAPLAVTAVNIPIDGTGVLNTATIQQFVNSNVTVTVAANFNGMTNVTGSSFTLTGGGTANLNNAAVIDQAAFFVSGGVTLALPSATSYAGHTHAGTFLRATGAGSRLDLPNLTSLIGSTFIGTVFVQAQSGGVVNLSNLATITGGVTQVLAEGADSQVNLSALTRFNDDNGNADSSLQARAGGAILIPNLTTLNAVNLVMDGTGTMATAQMVTYTGGNATITGIPANFSGMTDVSNSSFTLQGGGTANLNNASVINGASFFVNNGVTLALPSATSYSGHSHAGTFLRARGAGSRLDVSNLTSLAGSGFIGIVFLQAQEGGDVNLSSLSAITGGVTQVLAEGANSRVDLSALTSFNDNNGNNESKLEARNGGVVTLHPNTTAVTNVTVVLSPTGTIRGGTLQLGVGGALTGTGSLQANLTNGGLVAPGGSPGSQVIQGDYAQTAAGRLAIEITGLTPQSQFDVLQVTGQATLNGILEITRPGGFVPVGLNSFEILTFASRAGDFAQLTGASLPNGLVLHRIYDADSLQLVALPVMSIDSVAPLEGNVGTSPAVFTVSLSAAVGFPVSADFATQNGRAIAGVDYGSAAGTVTFAPGVTSRPIAVEIFGDPGREYDDHFFVNLFNLNNAAPGTLQGVGTIRNDDAFPSVEIDHVARPEGDSGATDFTFTVTLSSPASAPLSIDYATVDGTAQAGSDYAATAGMLNFAPAPSAGLVSNGSLGAFRPLGNVTLTLPADGIFHFTTIDIPAGVTVRFTRNATNTPAILLATGDVNIAGTIEISAVGQTGGAGGGNGGTRGVGLTGGGNGLGLSPGLGGGAVPPHTLGNAGGGGGLATAGLQAIRHTGGAPALGGAEIPFPEPILSRGGAGGGGGSGWQLFGIDLNGGAGGGAGGGLVIATDDNLSLSGTIRANGADGETSFANGFGYGGPGGGGSGGIIDLEANSITVAPTAILQATGGIGGGIGILPVFDPNFSSGANGGLGYVRITANQFTVDGTIEAESILRHFDVAKTISVAVNGDTDPETDETFRVQLSNPTNAVIVISEGRGAILDDDQNIPAPSMPDLQADSDTGSSPIDNVTRDSTPTFIGTAEPGSTVELFDGAASLGTTAADAVTGAWTFTSAGLADGGHSITATAAVSGFASNPSAPLSIFIDSIAPTIAASPDRGANGNNWYNADVTVTYTFSDNPGGSGTDLGASDVSADLLTATGTAAGTAYDLAGNSASASFFARIDKIAPTIFATPSVGPNANGWNNTDVTVTYTFSDDVGGSGVDNAASSTAADLLTASGTVSGTVVDCAGNSATAAYSALIDKVAPTIFATPSVGPNANGWDNTNVAVTYTFRDDVGGSGVDNAASSTAADLLTASGAVSGTVVDRAGNSATAGYSALIDKAAPTISAQRVTPANAQGWNNTDVVVSFSATDNLSGFGPGAGVLAASGSFTFTNEGAGQSHTFTVTDLAGNASSASVGGVNIDKAAPVPPTITSPTDGTVTTVTILAITGVAEPNARIEVFANAISLGTTSANAAGQWSLTTPALAFGSYAFAATATDIAGNASNRSPDVHVVVQDAGGPTVLDISAGPNQVNLNGDGVVPITVFGRAGFDVTTLDLSTLRLGGAAAVHQAFHDANGDGHMDLVLHFRRSDYIDDYAAALARDLADGTLSSNHQNIAFQLTGNTTGGNSVVGNLVLDLFMTGKKLQQLLATL